MILRRLRVNNRVGSGDWLDQRRGWKTSEMKSVHFTVKPLSAKFLFSLGLLAPLSSDAGDRKRAVRATAPDNFNAARWKTSFIFLRVNRSRGFDDGFLSTKLSLSNVKDEPRSPRAKPEFRAWLLWAKKDGW